LSSPAVLRRYNPADSSTVDGHVYRGRLRGGDAGVVQAIHIMRQLVIGTAFPGREYANEGALNPQIRALALSIVAGLAPKDKWAQANAIFQWVKSNIEFRGEVDELLQSPVKTVKLRAGDCDDHSSLLAALLMAIGFQVRFKTVAADKSQPQQFTHVYAEVNIPGRGWVPADTTVAQSVLGWRPLNVTRQKHWGALGSLASQIDRTLGEGGDNFNSLPSVPTSQIVADAVDPLAQALANLIQFGQVPAVRTGTTGFQLPGQTIAGDLTNVGIPSTILYLGLGLAGFLVFTSVTGRRR
jgi:hypothetical protein